MVRMVKFEIDSFIKDLINDYSMMCELSGFNNLLDVFIREAKDQGEFVNMLLTRMEEMNEYNLGWR